MKLAYQVAMPDLESSPLLTAYQGSLEDSFRHLAENGYQGIDGSRPPKIGSRTAQPID